MSEFKSPNFRNEDGSAAPDIVGVTTFASPYYFVPPSGTTAERPSGDGLAPGMLRFNTDIGRLEVWRGDHWATILGESPNLGNQNAAAGSSAAGTGARGVFAGGYVPGGTGNRTTIDYITISTLGNAIDFGAGLTSARRGFDGCGSATRGVMSGGNGVNDGGSTRVQDFITYASTGTCTSFGTLDFGRESGSCCSSSTRGFHCGSGNNPAPFTNVMNYFTIATTGSSNDFGDLTFTSQSTSSLSSPVRGIFNGLGPSPGAVKNNIDYWTISTTGNATSFGELSGDNASISAAGGNATRGIFSGIITPSGTNTIQFITIASTGNAQDFGDLDQVYTNANAVSSPTRYVIGAGNTPNPNNSMSYVTIATTGNGINFGDLTEGRFSPAACSNAHGGL